MHIYVSSFVIIFQLRSLALFFFLKSGWPLKQTSWVANFILAYVDSCTDSSTYGYIFFPVNSSKFDFCLFPSAGFILNFNTVESPFFPFSFFLQVDSNHSTDTPWDDFRANWIHSWSLYVQYDRAQGRKPLWSWHICR
jgi:hypothetical protein